MALWLKLNVNHEEIGFVEIRRREYLDLTDPAAIADTWSTYDVFRNGRTVGQVRHVYGHGAWKLLALASDLIAQEAAPAAEPAQCTKPANPQEYT